MVHFEQLERLGVSCAAMSDRADGDCGWAKARHQDRAAFLRRAGIHPGHLVAPRQHHSNIVVPADIRDLGKGAFDGRTAIADADGLATNVRGLPLGITVADCVPVFLFAPDKQAGALIHAGREGTRRRIAAGAVTSLDAIYGAKARHMHALVGPSAGPCCYEVSAELAEQWAAEGLPRRGRLLHLWEANRMQLMDAGVPEGQITVVGECTICGGRFHSYRAHRASHRNLAVLTL